MAAYTSSGTGNWADAATWGGSGPPVSGDTATISAGHVVTVAAAAAAGTSQNDVTTAAVTIAGTLTIAAGITLTLKGNLACGNGTLNMGANSVLTFDNSASGGSPEYRITSAGIPVFSLVGTAGNNAIIQAISGQSWAFHDGGSYRIASPGFTATYCTFRRLRTGGASGLNGYTGTFAFSYCTFDGCGTFDLYDASHNNVSLTIDNCTWTGSTGGAGAGSVQVQYQVTPVSGTRRIKGNIFDNTCTYVSKAFSVEGNAFTGGKGFDASVNVAYSTTKFRGNFVCGDGTANSSDGMSTGGDTDRNYFVISNATGNPHYVAGSALQGADVTIQQNVFESQTPNAVDTGDCVMVHPSSTSGGKKILIKNNIVTIGKHSESSGCLLTIYNNAVAVINGERNTGNVNNHAIASKRGMFAVAEASDGAADQLTILKGNIAHGTSASQGYLGERVQGNVKDIITASGADYNWCYNTSAGDNLRSYEDKVAANTMWAAGTAVDASADVNQGSGDPSFVDVSRTSVTWVAARGYGSTFADVLTAIAADLDRIMDLIAYVFEGHKPSAAGCRAAAHDGACVGAANWHDSTRTLTQATALYSELTTDWLT